MRLIDLHPRWVGAGGYGVFNVAEDGTRTPAPERTGVGLTFDCPCGKCAAERTGDFEADFSLRVYVGFDRPLDGGPPIDAKHHWQRTGETFETLTLRPSILDVSRCGWHGYVTDGEVTNA